MWLNLSYGSQCVCIHICIGMLLCGTEYRHMVKYRLTQEDDKYEGVNVWLCTFICKCMSKCNFWVCIYVWMCEHMCMWAWVIFSYFHVNLCASLCSVGVNVWGHLDTFVCICQCMTCEMAVWVYVLMCEWMWVGVCMWAYLSGWATLWVSEWICKHAHELMCKCLDLFLLEWSYEHGLGKWICEHICVRQWIVYVCETECIYVLVLYLWACLCVSEYVEIHVYVNMYWYTFMWVCAVCFVHVFIYLMFSHVRLFMCQCMNP